jgi:hemerythrin-like domain-containing protein
MFLWRAGALPIVGETGADAVCATPDPISIIEGEHALQLELCDLLDVIASDLPQMFDRSLAVIAVAILQGSVPAHTRFEDEALFPLLRRRLTADDPVLSALACLEREHEWDKGILGKLTEALKSGVGECSVQNPEALSFVLRGFSESHRRHIAWEEQVVLSAARAALTMDDLAELQTWIMSSEHPRCSRQSLLAIRSVRTGLTLCRKCLAGIPLSEVEEHRFDSQADEA